MKKLFMTFTIVFGLITIINAQGITNTLGGNTANDKFIVENSNSNTGLVVTGEGKVGIGTPNPAYKLDIIGTAQMTGFMLPVGQSLGYVLTSNHAGWGTWQPAPNWTISGDDQYSSVSGNVGIGTTDPTAGLDVNTDVILGEGGSRFLEIKEITGKTGSEYNSIDVSYPTGYTYENTRVLSLEIHIAGDRWVGQGDRIFSQHYLMNVSYILGWQYIRINYPDHYYYHNRSFRMILMRMP